MLAHVTDSKVVRTYRQTDFLAQRRMLQERWGRFCCGDSAGTNYAGDTNA